MFISLTCGLDGSEVEIVEEKMRFDILLLVSDSIFQAIYGIKFLLTAHLKLDSIAQNKEVIFNLLSIFYVIYCQK
jgi:hypothetical protein